MKDYISYSDLALNEWAKFFCQYVSSKISGSAPVWTNIPKTEVERVSTAWLVCSLRQNAGTAHAGGHGGQEQCEKGAKGGGPSLRQPVSALPTRDGPGAVTLVEAGHQMPARHPVSGIQSGEAGLLRSEMGDPQGKRRQPLERDSERTGTVNFINGPQITQTDAHYAFCDE